ncbi:MAG: hypothetical protein VB912_08685, partial [Pirellulaceae bacterium]
LWTADLFAGQVVRRLETLTTLTSNFDRHGGGKSLRNSGKDIEGGKRASIFGSTTLCRSDVTETMAFVLA